MGPRGILIERIGIGRLREVVGGIAMAAGAAERLAEAHSIGMEVGASGYVLKDSPSAQLVAAVRDICRGGSYLSPRMLSQLVDDFRSRIKSANRLPRFATPLDPQTQLRKLSSSRFLRRCSQVAKAADCKSAIVGSTPTSAF